MKIGDHVECIHGHDWQNARRDEDIKKGRKLGVSTFMGNASAYMHLDEAYVIEEITSTGGLRLRGFAPSVSIKDVRISTKPIYR